MKKEKPPYSAAMLAPVEILSIIPVYKGSNSIFKRGLRLNKQSNISRDGLLFIGKSQKGEGSMVKVCLTSSRYNSHVQCIK